MTTPNTKELTKEQILEKISRMDSDTIGKWHDEKLFDLKELQKKYYKLKDAKLTMKHTLEKKMKEDGMLESRIDRELRRNEDLYNLSKEMLSVRSEVIEVQFQVEILRDNYFRNK